MENREAWCERLGCTASNWSTAIRRLKALGYIDTRKVGCREVRGTRTLIRPLVPVSSVLDELEAAGQ